MVLSTLAALHGVSVVLVIFAIVVVAGVLGETMLKDMLKSRRTRRERRRS